MNNKKSKKLKNKHVTIEDMNELLGIISDINLKLMLYSAVTKSIDPYYTEEININTGLHLAIEKLKDKLKNT
jgi:hypothetical protein|tara:strand:- start:576 stop:791 length:216 start_codon:yes stop_codon:yes gene_type:complete